MEEELTTMSTSCSDDRRACMDAVNFVRAERGRELADGDRPSFFSGEDLGERVKREGLWIGGEASAWRYGDEGERANWGRDGGGESGWSEGD